MLILALSAAAAPAAMSSSAPLPAEMYLSAQRGELQNVAKWLRKGGLADALCPVPNFHGQTETAGLLHTTATHGHLVRPQPPGKILATIAYWQLLRPEKESLLFAFLPPHHPRHL